MFHCPEGAASSSPGLARLGLTLGTRGARELPQRGYGKVLPRGCPQVVALGNRAVETFNPTRRRRLRRGYGVEATTALRLSIDLHAHPG